MIVLLQPLFQERRKHKTYQLKQWSAKGNRREINISCCINTQTNKQTKCLFLSLDQDALTFDHHL